MAEEESIESQIKRTLLSRVKHFREQADSLTLEGVRRLSENDLGLAKYSLDVHKGFIKQLLSKLLDGEDEDSATKNSGETVEENVSSTKEAAESATENHQQDKDVKEPNSEDERKMEDSPVMGLLTETKSTKSGSAETEGVQKNEIPSEITIRMAMRKRAAYFIANSEKITVAGVRRLLEKDLKLEEFTLDPVKKFISAQLDEVLSSKTSKPLSGIKKRSVQCKPSKKDSSGESSDSLGSERGDIEDKVKPTKKVAQKGKFQKTEVVKKRKRPEKETKVSSKKLLKMTSEGNSDSGDDCGNDSEDGQSQSSKEKPVKKKEVAPPVAYGKDVEHLKSIIKSCGMSVGPMVYKKAKQVPDSKREAFIIKELEEILAKEGLSRNPSEKEIKKVKKRKERAKELEGIDTSNIVLSSRRRSTTSFVPPPKPKIPVESEGEDTEDSDNDADDDDNSDEDGDDSNVEDQDEVHEDEENSD